PCTGKAKPVHRARGGTQMAWAPDGSAIATVWHGGMAWIYDAEDLHERFMLREQRGGGGTERLAWSGDGTLVVTTGGSMGNVWNARTGKRVRELGAEFHVNHVALSPDGRQVAAAGDGAQMKFWDVESGALVRSLRVARANLRSAAFSPDWAMIAVATHEDVV